MNKIKILDHCVLCGKCAENYPNTFKLNPEGPRIEVISENIDEALEASDICPVSAIKVEE